LKIIRYNMENISLGDLKIAYNVVKQLEQDCNSGIKNSIVTVKNVLANEIATFLCNNQ